MEEASGRETFLADLFRPRDRIISHGSVEYEDGDQLRDQAAARRRVSARVYGAWRNGPWMAVRIRLNNSQGVALSRPRHVMEVKMPHRRYSVKEYRWKWVRDVVAFSIRHSRRWRAAEATAAEISRVERGSRPPVARNGSNWDHLSRGLRDE